MSRYNAIDHNITVLTRQLNRATADADYDRGYEEGARFKPLAECVAALNEEELTQRALFGLLLESDRWRKQLKHDPDGALEALETALMAQAKMYDCKRHC